MIIPWKALTVRQPLLFIPAKTPNNFYSADYEPGLQLYCKGVFIDGQSQGSGTGLLPASSAVWSTAAI